MTLLYTFTLNRVTTGQDEKMPIEYFFFFFFFFFFFAIFVVNNVSRHEISNNLTF